MRRSLIPLLLWLTVGPSGVQGAGPPLAMTPQAIEEAIALGRHAAPRPYALYRWIGDPGVHSASVYTPFIRVALASHVAKLEGRTLSPSNIDRALIEPVLYVAVRVHGPTDSGSRRTMTRSIHLAGPGLERVAPLWTRPPRSVLQSLEREREIDSVTFVAAFPLDAVKPRLEFAVRIRPSRWSEVVLLSRGLITPKEFDRWR